MSIAPWRVSFHQISVDMGRANFNPAALPALVNLPEAVNYPLTLADETLSVVLVSMGNPHCVVLVDKLDLEQVHRLGPQIEHHPLFPKPLQCAVRGNLSIAIP